MTVGIPVGLTEFPHFHWLFHRLFRMLSADSCDNLACISCFFRSLLEDLGAAWVPSLRGKLVGVNTRQSSTSSSVRAMLNVV